MLDYIYSRPDAMWTEMGMLTKLHNLWLNWLVEYEDGSLEGGYAWRGRPGTGFAAAHHFVDGVSTARSDAVLTTHLHRARHGQRRQAALGDDSPSISRSTGRPTGRCTPAERSARSRSSKPIAKSWNYTEYFPLNWWPVADYQAAHNGALRPLSVILTAHEGRTHRQRATRIRGHAQTALSRLARPADAPVFGAIRTCLGAD